MMHNTPETVHKIGTLMIVDDNAFDQSLYARITKRSGLVESLIQFTNPKEATDYLLQDGRHMPDLVLLDINMPGMDGFEFLELMSQRFGDKMCPVIVMLTTSLNPADEQRAARYGMVRDVLNKPLTQDTLEHLATLVH